MRPLSFFSWVSSAAVLSALKKILALLREKYRSSNSCGEKDRSSETCGLDQVWTSRAPHLQVDVQPLLGEIHGLKQLLVLTGRLNVLLLHHRAHLLLVLVSHGLEPVQRVELQVLVQQLQDVRHA